MFRSYPERIKKSKWRLKKLKQMKAPEQIIQNEEVLLKRLQQTYEQSKN